VRAATFKRFKIKQSARIFHILGRRRHSAASGHAASNLSALLL
jgi:hypothetical protein